MICSAYGCRTLKLDAQILAGPHAGRDVEDHVEAVAVVVVTSLVEDVFKLRGQGRGGHWTTCPRWLANSLGLNSQIHHFRPPSVALRRRAMGYETSEALDMRLGDLIRVEGERETG